MENYKLKFIQKKHLRNVLLKFYTIVTYSSVCSVAYYDPMIVIYSPSKGLQSCDRSFIVQATIILIVNYDHTVIMVINYDHKTFIVQPTGLN